MSTLYDSAPALYKCKFCLGPNKSQWLSYRDIEYARRILWQLSNEVSLYILRSCVEHRICRDTMFSSAILHSSVWTINFLWGYFGIIHSFVWTISFLEYIYFGDVTFVRVYEQQLWFCGKLFGNFELEGMHNKVYLKNIIWFDLANSNYILNKYIS